jgi:hypothetical protein
MWAVIVVSIGLLTGPEAVVVLQDGSYKSEQSCQAAIRANVPGKLDAAAKAAVQRGERRYVCVRVQEHGALPPH